MGIIWAYPPPAAPPFMPKTGPNEGSRKQIIVFFPIRFKASPSPTVVVVFPSPAGVGLMAVTKISLLFFFSFSFSKYDNETLALK